MDLIGRCKSCFSEKGDVGECPFCGFEEGMQTGLPQYLQIGTVLENKYMIGSPLGQGGFGITYLAWDINLNIKLAIKEYFPQELATRQEGHTEISAYTGSMSSDYDYGLEKFLEEARTLARFESHPHVVSVRDFFRANGTAYLVMFFVDGITLKEHVKNSGGYLTFQEAISLIIPVLDALNEVHAVNILHRDISPDNIFINKKGQVILLDFGAARQAISDKGRSLSIILKPGYAPEEQYRSKGKQGPWTDVYATAATLYHLITGAKPPESLERLADDRLVLPSVAGVAIEGYEEKALLKALAVRADERYQDAGQFRDALLGDKPISTLYTATQAPIYPSEPATQSSGGFTGKNFTAATSAEQSSPVSAARKGLPVPLLVVIALGAVILLGVTFTALWVGGVFGDDADTAGPVNDTQGATEETDLVLNEVTIDFDGGTYSGQALDGVPHGSGTWTHPDGIEYDGEWQNGKASGFGLMTWPNGDRYEGQWRDDMFNGTGTYHIHNGSLYDGEWFNDLRHGNGAIIFHDGDAYTGEWRADLMNGQGIFTWHDGRKYDGEFKDNMRDGEGSMGWPDGTRYEGQWKGDLMDGNGTLYLPDGERYEGEFKSDLFHGQGTFYFSDGSHAAGKWSEGQFVGSN